MTVEQPMKLHNALTRRVEELETLEAGVVRFYSCGPTVYDEVHIGNLRAFMFYDLLKRALRFLGYEVRHVMNITDVDDKTIRRSREQGVSLRELTDRYTAAFVEDLEALRIELPDVMPRATETIPQMEALIDALLERGLAYRSEDGSTYFAIERFEGYGQLVDLERTQLRAGASERVAADEYEKESVADFALWKSWVEADGAVAWEGRHGKGRPGWHLECSAMAMEHLGETIDLHAGGIDLKFPHHENEIAQSEGATGHPFARMFVHNKHLLVSGQKMSKSKRNFYTRRQLEREAGATGRELRFALLKTHYGRELNFQVSYGEGGEARRFDAVEDARSALKRLDDLVLGLRARSSGEGEVSEELRGLWSGLRGRFVAALADDLNVPLALGVAFELVGELHKRGVSGAEAEAALGWLGELDGVLGWMPEEEGLPEDLAGMLEERASARAARDWARSDELRDAFRERGYEVLDRPEGQVWRRL